MLLLSFVKDIDFKLFNIKSEPGLLIMPVPTDGSQQSQINLLSYSLMFKKSYVSRSAISSLKKAVIFM